MADEMEEKPFATYTELAKRWKQMPDDPDYVDQRLADASQFIREQCPDWRNISRATLERIACELAKDAISSDIQTEVPVSIRPVPAISVSRRAISPSR
ncbi:hypothetical protein GBK67_03815 [Bifidobacterium longum]|nr:hypothetical protein GBK67_03815 [Bifidobacterium longum]